MKGKNLAGTRSARRRQAAGLLLVVPLLLVLSLAGCRQEHKAAAPAVPVVEVVRVAQRDVPLYREWVGVLDGSVNAVIRPQVSGYLLRQQYREGDLVRKGQVLFEIDPRTFQAAVNQARAALDQAKGDLARQEAMALTARADLARVRPLAAKNAVSKKDLDDAIGRELSTRAGVEGHKLSIHAPLIAMSKADIIQQGVRLGVDYAHTVSCYQADPEGRACGVCDACRLRRQGFDQAGVSDPTVYQKNRM